MIVTLKDLIEAANRHYPGGFLTGYFDEKEQRAKREKEDEESWGDTLAHFIVREICDTFEAKAEDDVQVAAATKPLRRAQEDLELAIKGLEQLALHQDPQELCGDVNCASCKRKAPPRRRRS